MDAGRRRSSNPVSEGLNVSVNKDQVTGLKNQARGKVQKGAGDLKEAVSDLKQAAKK